MECPFELPVHKDNIFILDLKDEIVAMIEHLDETDYIVQAINRHEKLVKQIEKDAFAFDTAINMTPSGDMRNKLTEMNIERLQALRE